MMNNDIHSLSLICGWEGRNLLGNDHVRCYVVIGSSREVFLHFLLNLYKKINFSRNM